MMTKLYKRLFGIGLCLGLVTACATEPQVTSGADGPSIAQAQAEAYDGPKARIAVAKIIDKSGDKGKRSLSYHVKRLENAPGFDSLSVDGVTAALRDMLTTALFNSNRYIVLEREAIDAVMVEQEFSASGRVGEHSSIPMGNIEGAELLVVVALTGFEPAKAGGSGFPIPIPLGKNGDLAVVYLSLRKSYASMDVRVIDVRTSRVVASVAVEGSVRKTKAALSGYLHSNSGGHIELPVVLSGFTNTPIEQALQKMVNAAVADIVAKTPEKFYH